MKYLTDQTDLGVVGILMTEAGLASVGFYDSVQEAESFWVGAFAQAQSAPQDALLRDVVSRVQAYLAGEHQPFDGLALDLARYSDFQRGVWRYLQMIPYGETRTYSAVTEALKLEESAVRAVAGAIAQNPLAVVIPCHRVVGKSGDLTGFRWGIARKKRLLLRESPSDLLMRSLGEV